MEHSSRYLPMARWLAGLGVCMLAGHPLAMLSHLERVAFLFGSVPIATTKLRSYVVGLFILMLLFIWQSIRHGREARAKDETIYFLVDEMESEYTKPNGET